MLALNTSILYLSVGYNTFRLSVNRCALNISLICSGELGRLIGRLQSKVKMGVFADRVKELVSPVVLRGFLGLLVDSELGKER